MYYDYTKILSYNAFFNFLVGSRGVGKTYGASKFVVKQAIKNKSEFVYIRRYKSDLKKCVPQFFNALIVNDEFKDHSLYTKGNKFYIDDEIVGYAIALSEANSYKSTNFSKVRYIIFDEFIIENNSQHYISNEVEVFLSIIETIARMRRVNVFLLGNNVSMINPYFLFFNISAPYNSDIKTYKDGLILVQVMNNEEYMKAKKQTDFGKIVEGTDYSTYAIENKPRLDNKDFIEKKTKTARCTFSFKYKDNIYGVWFDFNAGKVFVSQDHASDICFSCTLEDHSPNTMFYSVAKDYHAWKTFIKNYKLGNVYFESIKIKNICQDLIKNLITH